MYIKKVNVVKKSGLQAKYKRKQFYSQKEKRPRRARARQTNS